MYGKQQIKENYSDFQTLFRLLPEKLPSIKIYISLPFEEWKTFQGTMNGY